MPQEFMASIQTVRVRQSSFVVGVEVATGDEVVTGHGGGVGFFSEHGLKQLHQTRTVSQSTRMKIK